MYLKIKKGIKKYSESIDYEKLKNNIYIPTSRLFGLFKYKSNPILKVKIQIIVFIPEIYIYDRESFNFISFNDEMNYWYIKRCFK